MSLPAEPPPGLWHLWDPLRLRGASLRGFQGAAETGGMVRKEGKEGERREGLAVIG